MNTTLCIFIQYVIISDTQNYYKMAKVTSVAFRKYLCDKQKHHKKQQNHRALDMAKSANNTEKYQLLLYIQLSHQKKKHFKTQQKFHTQTRKT